MPRVCVSILLVCMLACSSKPTQLDIESALSAASSSISGNDISLRSCTLKSLDGEIARCEVEFVFNTNCRWMGSGMTNLDVFKTKPVAGDGKGAWPMYTFGEVQKRPDLLEGELVTPGTTRKLPIRFALRKENGAWVATNS